MVVVYDQDIKKKLSWQKICQISTLLLHSIKNENEGNEEKHVEFKYYSNIMTWFHYQVISHLETTYIWIMTCPMSKFIGGVLSINSLKKRTTFGNPITVYLMQLFQYLVQTKKPSIVEVETLNSKTKTEHIWSQNFWW